MLIRRIWMIIALIGVAGLVSTAHAATRYVDATPGSNCSGNYSIALRNCSGSDGNSYTTVQGAHAAASASDTMILRSGTYTLAANLTFTSAQNGQTWRPAQNEAPIISGGGTNRIIAQSGAANITFQGLTFQNMGAPSMYFKGSNFNVRWNTFLNCNTACIQCDSMQSSIIDSNTMDGQSPGNPGGDPANANASIMCWFGSSNNTISHNLIKNAEGGGVAFTISATDPPNNTNVVDRNLLQNVGTNVIDMGAIYMGDRTHSATGNQITNNRIENHGGYTINTSVLNDNNTQCIYLDDLMSNATVTGNICRGAGEYVVQYGGGDNNTVQNNIVHICAGGCEIGFPFHNVNGIGMPGNTFTNNLVYSSGAVHNPLWNICCYDGDAVPSIHDNLYFSATGATFPNSGAIVDTNRVLADPLFANAAAGDYSMPGNSPAFASPVSFQALATDQGPLANPFITQSVPPAAPTNLRIVSP